MKVASIIQNNSIWIPGAKYNDDTPIISILMPTYGRGKNGFFKRAVKSFMQQTLKEIELIIIDDANHDGTSEQIEELMKKDGRISCIRHKNNVGLPTISVYEGYLKARGEYIGYLFDDCVLLPTAYERTIQIMNKRKVLASYGRCFVHTDKKDLRKGTWIHFQEEMLDNLECLNQISNLTIVCHKSVYETVGWCDPHITMLRINDWDLIMRIKRRFELIDTGVKFGEEYGITQNNSLGNSAIIDHQSFIEHMRYYKDREKMLLIKNYAEYDVLHMEDDCSMHFLLTLKEQLKRFYKKSWFKEANFTMNISGNEVFTKDYININIEDMITPSVSLIFNPMFAKNKSIFLYPSYHNILAHSRAVIFPRATRNTQMMEKARIMNLARFLFWDDNFIELGKIHQDYAFITPHYAKEFFKQFDGIIVTNNTFAEELKKAKYHKNVIVCEANYPQELEQKISKRQGLKDKINISFMGGAWRSEKLIEYIIPALIELSVKYDITLICPKHNVFIKMLNEYRDKLDIKLINVTHSIEQLIYKYSKNNIHIQLHPSVESVNNIYKTKNALLNASLLGAALIAADDAPYNKVEDGEEGTYLLAGDSVISWREAIEELILDESKRVQTINKARIWCAKRYSGDTEEKMVESILDKTKEINYMEYMQRVANGARCDGVVITPEVGSMEPSVNVPIIASDRIKKSTIYRFKSNVITINEVRVIFGTHMQLAEGTCRVRLYSMDKELITEREIELLDIIDNAKYSIHISPIYKANNKEFYIEFLFEYSNETEPISIYEVNNLFPQNRILRKIAKVCGKTRSLYIELE